MFQLNQIRNNRKLLTLTTATTILVGNGVFFNPVAIAQNFNSILISQNNTNTIQATSAQKETIYLNNDRTYSYNLIAGERTVIDGVVIPAGATIVGKYVPAKGGLRYVAEAVTYGNYSYRINATSDILKDVKDPRDTSVGSIATDAGIGAAGGAVLGEVLGGGAGVGEIVGGAAAGAAVGNITADRVVVIKPDTPITLYSN
ncbi:hypothetical protein STA3757_03060 [Stanieria sp. NIES-3757]|nr:hypothetical protein STA3757_03060 [Stanieria sp. NIES-3757]